MVQRFTVEDCVANTHNLFRETVRIMSLGDLNDKETFICLRKSLVLRTELVTNVGIIFVLSAFPRMCSYIIRPVYMHISG